MKNCSCGYTTDKDAVFRCDRCGRILHAQKGTAAAGPTTERRTQIIGEVYAAETKLANVFAVIAVCLAIIIGVAAYKHGISVLPSFLGLMGLRYVVSLVLISIVSLVTAAIMGISFGTIGRFVIKMTAVIFVADTIMYLIPYQLIAGLFAFVVCIAMVERYFKLEWDGLLAFVIVSSVMYIFGWLWLTGLYDFSIARANDLFILYWRKFILVLIR